MAAPLLRGRTLLFEDIGLGVELKRRVGKTKSARQRPHSDEHGRCMRVGVFDRDRNNVVVAKDFDRALGATGAIGHEQHRFTALARLSVVGDPIADSPTELQCRLRGDVMDAALVLQ